MFVEFVARVHDFLHVAANSTTFVANATRITMRTTSCKICVSERPNIDLAKNVDQAHVEELQQKS
jgi:hypothetical protein